MQLSSQRAIGLIIGLSLGLGYAVASNFVNGWVMPGIPLSAPWPGRIGVALLTTAVFGLLGLLAAWTEESIPGILLTGVAGSFLTSIWIFMSASSILGGVFAMLALVFLPRMFFYVPFGWLVRWIMDRLIPHPHRAIPPARRWASALMGFAAVSLLGLFSLYGKETRLSLTRMEAIMQEGAKATSREELPAPLQKVEGFIPNAKGAYAFEVGSNPDALPVQRPIVQYGEEESFIIVKFKNGFRFGCVFSPPYIAPACIDF